MKVVAPLAGPDFLTARFGVRPLVEVDGEPLIRRALTSRSWWRMLAPGDLCFVIRETPETPAFRRWLLEAFPGARIVELSGLTQGAMQSALAGVAAVVDDPCERLCIDLADILFDCPWPAIDTALENAAAVAPYFDSDDPDYSYLQLGDDGRVRRAAEKEVISRHASAGVYFFATAAAFMTAAEHAHRAWAAGEPRALFVCPALNGLIARGERVTGVEVGGVRPIGKAFHRARAGG